MTNITPLTPTASLLLESLRSESRTVLTILSSDLHVAGMVNLIADFLGFETTFTKLYQSVGADSLAHLAIATDIWISGSRVKSEVVASSQMSLGSLVVTCLAPMVLDQSISETDSKLQIDTASFALFTCLTHSLVARQTPAEFEQAAAVAKFRQIPVANAYESIAGESMQVVAGRLASAWGLPRMLAIALGGPSGYSITARERMMIDATDVATQAAQSTGVALEPWPYSVQTERIEQIALISAMGMRAKRVSTRLEDALQSLRAA